MAQTPSESINNAESQGAAGLDSFFRQDAGNRPGTAQPLNSVPTGLDGFFRQDAQDKQQADKPAAKSSGAVTASGFADIQDPTQRDNLNRFLSAIGASEGADYNTVVGGGKFSDMSRHPGITGLVTKDGPSTAAGRYQITGTTYRDIASKIGVTDFSPESQDKIAVALLQRRGALDDVLSGNFNSAVSKLGNEWQSLPSGTSKNQGKRTQAFFDKALTLASGSSEAQAATPAADPLANAPKWAAVIAKPEYQAMSDADKAGARTAYFQTFIEPGIAQTQRGQYRTWFDTEAAKVEEAAQPSTWKSIKAGVSGAIDAAGKLLEPAPTDATGPYANLTPQAAAVSRWVDGITGKTPPRQGAASAAPASDPALKGSVMAGAPAMAGSTSPVSPAFNAQFNAAWDAATPHQRTLMAQRPGVLGDLAKARNDQYAKSDVLLAGAEKTASAIDTRAESRASRLARNGMAPELTVDYARNAAARGVMPGDEVGSISNSTFDFDTQKKFSEDPFFSNPVVRGAVKGYEGFKVGALGVNQFLGETVGADTFARTQADAAKASKNFTDGIGEPQNYGQRMFEGAISSIAQQVPALIGGAVTGSEALVLGSMFAQSFGQEYSDGRSRGQSQGDATLRAGLFGTFEVIGEKFGLGETLKGLRGAVSGMAVKDVSTHLARALLREIPGEELTTLGQFMTDKLPAGIGLNTEAGMSEYLSQAADTLVQTVLQGGMMTGAGAGVAHGANKFNTPERQIAREIRNAQPGAGNTDAIARTALNPDQGGIAPQDTVQPVTSTAAQPVASEIAPVAEQGGVTARPEQAATADAGVSTAAPMPAVPAESDAIDAAHLLDDDPVESIAPTPAAIVDPAMPLALPKTESPTHAELVGQRTQAITNYKDAAASGDEAAAQAAEGNLTTARQELDAAHAAAAKAVSDQLAAVHAKVLNKPKTEKEAKARREAAKNEVAAHDAGGKFLRDGLGAILSLHQDGMVDKRHAEEAQTILSKLEDNSININDAQNRFDAVYDQITAAMGDPAFAEPTTMEAASINAALPAATTEAQGQTQPFEAVAPPKTEKEARARKVAMVVPIATPTDPLSERAIAEAAIGGTKPVFSLVKKAVPESQWLSTGVLTEIVEKHMAQIATPIPVRIIDRLTDIATGADNSWVANGATFNGVVHLIREGLPTQGKAVVTLFHELLHFGLRRFLTKDQYISTMRQLYQADGWIRAEADRWVAGAEGRGLLAEGRAPGYVRARGVDEALANLSETINTTETGYNNTSIQAKIIRTVSRWMARLADKLGFKEAAANYRAVNNDEARALVKSIFAKLRSGESPETTSTEWQHSDPSFSLHSTAEATQSEADMQGGQPFATQQQRLLPRQEVNTASWNAPEPTRLDNLIYKMQDKHIDLRRVVQSIAKSNKPADDFDPYLQEELFHSRASSRVEAFVNKELTPLLKNAVARQLSLAEIDQYLHARHAVEANALIAKRNPDLSDGGSGMTDKDAHAYFVGLPRTKHDHLAAIAAKVDVILAETRRLYASYGLESVGTVKEWANMFEHYVPLMREDDGAGMGIGQGFSIKGKEVRHRTGSTSAVVDILANIALQREKVIVRGEKNRVAVALAGLAKLNPNPDFWAFDKVPTQQVFNPQTGLVETHADPMFKNRENVVVAKIKDSKGEIQERAIVFSEDNERALRMAQAIKNLDAAQLDGLLGVSAKVTRYFAAINTQYNPIFGVVNLVRDTQEMVLNLGTTPLQGKRKDVLSNVGPALAAIYRDTRAERKGHAGVSKMAALWEEFNLEGGSTGFRDMYANSADRADAIMAAMDPIRWMDSPLGKVFTAGGALKVQLSVAQEKASWLFDLLSDYNTAMENATRLSVYKVAREQGMSKQQSASLAKNITVNFNRKGQAGPQAGALYAFFNAAMQGTARMAQNIFTMEGGDIKTARLSDVGKKIVAGGILLGVVQTVLLAMVGFDDDEPPEFVRERNIIIPIGGKKYLTIPMPLGYHAIPNIGRITTEFALDGFKNPAAHTLRLFGVFADAFNPIGSAGLSMQTIAPTALDPFAALAENRDWTGKPIAKPTFDKLAPGHTLIKSTASAPAKMIAEAINFLSGGTDYVAGKVSPTPDQIDYLFGQVTGGVGRELNKTAQSATAIATGDDLPAHKIPLAGRFYGDAENSFSQSSKFFTNTIKLREYDKEIKGRLEDHQPIQEYIDKNPGARMIIYGKAVEKQVKLLRVQRKQLEVEKAPSNEIKEVNDRITDAMRQFNERMKAVAVDRQ